MFARLKKNGDTHGTQGVNCLGAEVAPEADVNTQGTQGVQLSRGRGGYSGNSVGQTAHMVVEGDTRHHMARKLMRLPMETLLNRPPLMKVIRQRHLLLLIRVL